jgi:hypothetical protein
MDRTGITMPKNEWSGKQHPLHSEINSKQRGWVGKSPAHPLCFRDVRDQGNYFADAAGAFSSVVRWMTAHLFLCSGMRDQGDYFTNEVGVVRGMTR